MFMQDFIHDCINVFWVTEYLKRPILHTPPALHMVPKSYHPDLPLPFQRKVPLSRP